MRSETSEKARLSVSIGVAIAVVIGITLSGLFFY
jgi:hypothetical protein